MDAARLNKFATDKGYQIPQLIKDSKVHRFKNHGESRDNSWYIAFSNSDVVQFGSWKSGETHTYHERHNGNGKISAKHRAEMKLEREKARVSWLAEKQQSQDEAQVLAKNVFNVLPEIKEKVTYLHNKGIAESMWGCKSQIHGPDGWSLVVPMRDETNMLCGLQFIAPDGSKLFLAGQKTSLARFKVGGNPQPGKRAWICEGVATGISIHMATTEPTIMSLSLHNLPKISKHLKEKYPDTQWIIAADNDAFTEGNPGLKMGQKIQRDLGLKLVSPKFKDVTSNPTDFNDLMLLEGLDTVRLQLKAADKLAPPKATDGKEKRVKAKLFRKTALAVNNGELSHNYHVIEPEPGVREILIGLGEGVVKYCKRQAVANDILEWSLEYPEYQYTAQTAKEAADYWLGMSKPITEPNMVNFKSDAGLCFRRLNFNCGDTCPIPVFEELMSRVSNARALAAFIGSLFFLDSYSQQYLWGYGDGMNGKGALMKLLEVILDQAVISVEVPEGDGANRFFNEQLKGKRLVIFPEVNQTKFVKTAKFKMLTGGDMLRAEPKGKESYRFKSNAKVILISNKKPDITGNKSDVRRIILNEFEPIGCPPDPNYQKKLEAEIPGIINGCMDVYLEDTINHGPIPTDDTGLQDLVAQNNESFDAMSEQEFDFEENPPKSFIDRVRTSSTEMTKLFESRRMTDEMRKDYYDYLKRMKNVIPKILTFYEGKTRVSRRYYVGMSIKNPDLMDRVDKYSKRHNS